MQFELTFYSHYSIEVGIKKCRNIHTMEPRREILYCGSHLYWSNLRWLSCTRVLKRWGNNTPMTASPGLASVPGIEVRGAGVVQVPGVATMLLTWPSAAPENLQTAIMWTWFCISATLRCLRVVAASVGWNNSISSRHATGWVPQAAESFTLSYN